MTPIIKLNIGATKLTLLALGIFFCILVAASIVHAVEVTATDSFLKTVKKIAKRESRDAIVKHVTEQDPQAGIVARDLVEKVIDVRTQDDIVQATIEVVTTMMFLKNIEPSINQLIEENPEILEKAKIKGWDQSKLAAYTGLYYFFSERLKFKLPVPNEIYSEYKNEREIVETLTVGNAKWTSIVSRRLIPGRKDPHKWFLADVRAILLIQQLVLDRLDDKFQDEPYPMADVLAKNLNSKNATELTTELIDHYQKLLKPTQSGEMEIAATMFSDKFLSESVIFPVFQVLIPENSSLIGTENIKEGIAKSINIVLNSWLENLESASPISYKLLLSGQANIADSSLRFSIQDQFRFSFSKQTFCFVGGFIDPTLQSVSENKKIPFGVGYSLSDRWLGAVFLNYLLNDLRVTPEFGMSLGYEIKLSDLEI